MKKMLCNHLFYICKNKIVILASFLAFFFFGCHFYVYGQQEKAVFGTVVDSTSGAPLPGVSVIVVGSGKGVITNDSGEYTLSIQNEGATLQFSSIGYYSKIVPVNSRSTINVAMLNTTQSLQQLVVVGYGEQKKEDVTGAISQISGKALTEVPVTSVPQMLQGRVGGVSVVSAGNKPGDGVAIRIRGRRSFNAGNDPLFIVDGIPFSGGFNDINPSDVASIEILKDASATAIYGSRGANGVILITTKRGKSGEVVVNYNAYFGISQISRFPDLMTGPEFAEYKRESRRSVIDPQTGLPKYNDDDPEADKKLFGPVELESIAKGHTTHWVDLLVHNGYVQNHYLNILGGGKNTKVSISLGYFNNRGIIDGQNYTRYTTHVNVDQKIGKRFKVGISMLGSYSIRNGDNVNPLGGGADYGALSENPLGVPYNEDGTLIFRPTQDGLRTNPLSDVVPGAVVNREKRFRLFNSLYGEVDIINGLKFRMNFGPDLMNVRNGDFRGRFTNSNQGGIPSASVADNLYFSYTWENILTYKKLLGQKHKLDLTGLYSIQNSRNISSSSNVSGIPLESLQYFNLGSASIIDAVASDFSDWTIESFMARFNYSFDNRFLLTLTGRADGSSKFAKGNKWGFFPSIALGWSINRERFLQNSSWISLLKLRLSYGKTGNQGINPYQTLGLLSRTGYVFGDEEAFGYRPSSITNTGLEWESTNTFNMGVDFGFFNNRVSGSFEVYRATTVDLLLPRQLPISSGFHSVLTNIGSKRNIGFGLTLSTRNVIPKVNKGFEWSTNLSLYKNIEKIISLSQGKNDDIGNRLFIGHPAVVYYDYVKTGIWQLGQKDLAEQYSSIVGGIKVKDINNNGKIDPDDRQILGSDVPKLIVGLTNRFSYKDFDLSIVSYGRFGSMIVSPFYGSFRFLSGRVNQYDLDYWTKSNPTNAFPQPNSNLETPYFGSTLQYFDGSFVKIRSISLGYNFSLKTDSDNIPIRVYLTAKQPLVFSSYVSKYNGMDPEDPTRSTPSIRTFLVGFNIKF